MQDQQRQQPGMAQVSDQRIAGDRRVVRRHVY